MRVTTKYGAVSIDHAADLVIDSRHGTVEVVEVTGRLEAVFGHGHVRIDRVGADATVRGSHGSIELGTTHGAVEVTTSGPLTIDRALGDVTASSAHGAIRIREAHAGTVTAHNGYSGIEVGVPAGVAAWVDAASTHGAVRNDLTPDPDAAASDRVARLHLHGDWADMVIRRARALSTQPVMA